MSKKPNILIAMDTMNCGGIEKSLISLLSSLDCNDVDVTLLLNRKTGIFLNSIPDWVNIQVIKYTPEVINERSLGKKKYLINLLKEFKFSKFFKSYKLFSVENRLQQDELLIHRINRFQDNIIKDDVLDATYDLGVSYANFEQMMLVANKIKAHRKLAFFHTQIEGLTNNIRQYIDIFKKYNSLYCVSKDLTLSIKNSFPELLDKIHQFPHIINVREIHNLGQKYSVEWHNDSIRILSVGRLDRQKGFDLIPDIALKLRNAGIKFQWIIIGEGIKYDEITNRLQEFGLNDNVSLIGVKDNPYPFFASCDIYVQPSRYEGYCLTLAEARVFAKPIVATYFDGATEQLENGKCGILVDFDSNQLFNAIKELCQNTNLRAKLRDQIKRQKVEDYRGAEIFLKEAKH